MADIELLKPEAPVLEGIGGWLAVPLIGLILAPLRQIYSLSVDVLPGFEAETWRDFTTPGTTAYSSWWAPYLIVSAIFCVCIAVWAIVLVVLFFKRKRQVPVVMSLFYLANVAAMAFEALSVRRLAGELALADEDLLLTRSMAYLVGSMVGSAIWIAYFFKSVRVRNTFVR